ncbi:Signal recognition particle receptor FtsY [hydrothermal vent metagenome]|uniref:Signal recognition particle receptor FtsY n=1 Tax=hydrothermal vent metagenome TaxID=652676 RepID=A0A3B1AK30_9ZZZZ
MALFSFKKPKDNTPEQKSWFNRLKAGLANTRKQLSSGLGDLVLGQRQIDDDLFEEIETALLMADVGVEATQDIIQSLTQQTSRKELADGEALLKALRVQLVGMLAPISQPLTIPEQDNPYSILVVGVNGAGKTTTIGKLAKHLQNGGEKILLAAGDTFRAAAIEQLQTWGERNEVTVISQQTGSDCAAVVFDAMQAASARKIDVLIADTAGRLQTQSHLMDELKKVKRVMQKHDASAPHEVMLVLDASTGQNALVQATQFSEAVKVTGITLTKLDGTAKGGIVFAIAKQLNIPIRFIGIGEGVDDLQVFDAETFVDALLDLNN